MNWEQAVKLGIERHKILRNGGYDIERLLKIVPDEYWTEVFILGNNYGWETIIQGAS